MGEFDERLRLLEAEIERRLLERFAALRDEFDRLRLESDSRWAGFLSRFDQDFTGIVPPELVPQPPAPPAPPPAPAPPERVALAGQISSEVIRALDDAGNQVEALNRFLDGCRHYCSRAALLIAKGGGLGVWKAVGFSDHGGSDEGARKHGLPLEEGGLLARVMEGMPGRLEKGSEVSAQLGCGDAVRGVLIPMVVKEKISGALYADCVSGEEEQFDPEAIGLLTFVAGLVVDRLASRKLKPAPALRSLDEVAAAPPPSPVSSYGTQMMEMPRAEDVAPPPPPPPVEPASEPRGWAISGSTPRPHFVEPSPPPPPAPSEESFGESADGGPGLQPPSPISAPRPSTSARRLAGPLAHAEGDERREEARRFAKLLVSEIKLYNERAVLEGREQGNIYERLKEDIDRSRQMYDERIPEDVRASSNFFHEELVRILANGRPEALGVQPN